MKRLIGCLAAIAAFQMSSFSLAFVEVQGVPGGQPVRVEIPPGGTTLVDSVEESFRISVTPTISTLVYAAGRAVGGLLTFPNAARISGRGCTIQSVVIVDNDSERAELNLVLFDRTFTATADQSLFNPSDADLANCVGVVEIATGNYAPAFSGNSVATRAGLGLQVQLNGTSLFGQLLTRGAPTYTASNDLTVILTVIRD